jgi:hypothetical protein
MLPPQHTAAPPVPSFAQRFAGDAARPASGSASNHWEVVLLRRSLTASVAVLSLTTAANPALGAESAPGAQIAAVQQQETGSTAREARAYYSREISRFQRETWHWQRVMGAPLTAPVGRRKLAELSPTAVQRTASEWRRRSTRAHTAARHPPHLSQFLCIHRYEASWRDSGAPYYGGLQMDLGFQQSYGGWLYTRKGTADHWSPLEQIWTAENALKSRGFWPWPNTARYCGLI